MKDILKYFAFILFVCCCVNLQNKIASAKKRFDGNQVLRTFPTTVEQVRNLHKLQLEGNFDFWSDPVLNGPTDIRFTPATEVVLKNFLAENGIRYEVFIRNIQEAIDKEDGFNIRSSKVRGMDWTNYHSGDQIQAWLMYMVAYHSDIAEVIEIGISTESRKMLVIRIGYPSQDGSLKKSYFADAGLHAREWIAPAICTYFINELLTNRDQFDGLLKEIDFYFLPIANPDGYDYSRTTDRMWRKTRSNNGDDNSNSNNCVGVDPNRNFDVDFGGNGSSSIFCSEIYKGPKAFSEPETRAISEFILNRKADWRVYNSFHSYGQKILTPWSYTDALPEDHFDLKQLADECAVAIEATSGTQYEVGNTIHLMYAISGGSSDWAKLKGGFKYSYLLEVGHPGFVLPASDIIPIAKEVWECVLTFANSL